MKSTHAPYHRYLLPLANLAAFLVVLFVNYSANAVPINGKTTGEVSDQYPNLFTPAPVTFSIWGVIYLGLAAFVAWQLSALGDATGRRYASVAVQRIGPLFLLNCLLNATWIFVWHYDGIALSVVIMLGILATLIAITQRVFVGLPNAPVYRWLLRLPFGLYLGWISVATIANVTAWLVHLRWDGFGFIPLFWVLFLLLTATLIAIAAIWRHNNVFYGAAVTWAFAGIVIRQMNAVEPSWLIMVSALTCAVVVLVVSLTRLRAFLHPATEPADLPAYF